MSECRWDGRWWPDHGKCDQANAECRAARIKAEAENDRDCYKSRGEPEETLWLLSERDRYRSALETVPGAQNFEEAIDIARRALSSTPEKPHE